MEANATIFADNYQEEHQIVIVNRLKTIPRSKTARLIWLMEMCL